MLLIKCLFSSLKGYNAHSFLCKGYEKDNIFNQALKFVGSLVILFEPHKLSWKFCFFKVSGLSKLIGDQLTVFKDFEPWLMNLVLCFIVAGATEVTSNTAICTLMMPIMKELVRYS